MNERETAGRQQAPDRAEVLIEIGSADMFHHADGYEPVKAALDLAIVLLPEGDLVGDAGRACQRTRSGELLGRHVDRGHANSTGLCEVNCKRAPA